jgi:hypothetical protein
MFGAARFISLTSSPTLIITVLQNPSAGPAPMEHSYPVQVIDGRESGDDMLVNDLKILRFEQSPISLQATSYLSCNHQELLSRAESTLNTFIMEPVSCIMMGVGLVFSLIILQFL